MNIKRIVVGLAFSILACVYTNAAPAPKTQPESPQLSSKDSAASVVQVQIQVRMVQYKLKDVDDLLRQSEGTNNASLWSLWKEGKGKLVREVRMTTQPGIGADVKNTIEYKYPGRMEVQGGGTNGPCTAVVPANFETREVGTMLSAKPEVSPDRQVITLSLTGTYTGYPDWHEASGSIVTAGGKQFWVSSKVPFYQVFHVNTVLKIRNGETVLAGSANLIDGDDPVFMFVTARLLTVGSDKTPAK